ncbi:hypothetical protein KQI76_04765 [Amphibacillus sp. MSJ-3]|uniref:hypothetical protein n=1 Tax=Amphibacillus sp. MSJ-3 TaxID=2841505 RepID=UPI001C0F1E4D|nr:hypothetical protein [Amphibacillus sp. MSJ-3]MBU5594469.1 hypothetical protein [Amphibacillus sp. MSJ-3]
MGAASGAQDVGQLDVAIGRGGFSLTILIAPLPCRNKDFRMRTFPTGVANHLIGAPDSVSSGERQKEDIRRRLSEEKTGEIYGQGKLDLVPFFRFVRLI